jgi:hypothetical protein
MMGLNPNGWLKGIILHPSVFLELLYYEWAVLSNPIRGLLWTNKQNNPALEAGM